jgi:hypothetical protein
MSFDGRVLHAHVSSLVRGGVRLRGAEVRAQKRVKRAGHLADDDAAHLPSRDVRVGEHDDARAVVRGGGELGDDDVGDVVVARGGVVGTLEDPAPAAGSDGALHRPLVVGALDDDEGVHGVQADPRTSGQVPRSGLVTSYSLTRPA